MGHEHVTGPGLLERLRRHAPSATACAADGGADDAGGRCGAVAGGAEGGGSGGRRRRKGELAVRWKAGAVEHVFSWTAAAGEGGGGGRQRHVLHFPSPASLAARLELAELAGLGVSVWEAGQGLEAFFELL